MFENCILDVSIHKHQADWIIEKRDWNELSSLKGVSLLNESFKNVCTNVS